MLYIIKHKNGTYFHNKGKIILFESEEQAAVYLNAFTQYAVDRLLREQGRIEAMTAPITIQNNIEFMPVDFDIDKVECGVVYLRDL